MAEDILLSNGTGVKLPIGADPTKFKRIKEAELRLAAQPKPKRKAPKDNGRRKSSKRRMDSRIGWAVVELVSRVNDIPFDGSAPRSLEEITVEDYYGI